MITTTSILVGIIGLLIGIIIGLFVSFRYSNKYSKQLINLHQNYSTYLKQQSEFHRSNLEMLKSMQYPFGGVKVEYAKASIPDFIDKLFKMEGPMHKEKAKEDIRQELIKALNSKDAKFDPDASIEELQRLWDLLQ